MEAANVLNDVSTSHANGPTMTTAPMQSTTCGTTFEDRRLGPPWPRRGRDDGAAEPALDIVHPPLLEPELERREDQDRHHEHEGDGGRVAAVVVDEAGLVGQVDDRRGGGGSRVVC